MIYYWNIIKINGNLHYYFINDISLIYIVVNAKALSIMRYQDDINTEHNMKSIGRAAMAHWTKRLTRNGQTRVRIREAHIFDITIYIYIYIYINGKLFIIDCSTV